MDNNITSNLDSLSAGIVNGPVGVLPKGSSKYYDDIIFSLNSIAVVLTTLLLAWNVIVAVIESNDTDNQTKEKISYINTKLFGTSGLINNLFGLWVVFLGVIYIVYGLSFINNTLISSNIRVNEISEKSILENLPIIGKLVGLINSVEK